MPRRLAGCAAHSAASNNKLKEVRKEASLFLMVILIYKTALIL
jgi:hypothetical protein